MTTAQHEMVSNRIAEYLDRRDVSFWLKDVAHTAFKRDPVDALRDAETLVAMLKDRWDSMQ